MKYEIPGQLSKFVLPFTLRFPAGTIRLADVLLVSENRDLNYPFNLRQLKGKNGVLLFYDRIISNITINDNMDIILTDNIEKTGIDRIIQEIIDNEELHVFVSLGSAGLPLSKLNKINHDSMIILERPADSRVEVFISGTNYLVYYGDLLDISGHYGVRINKFSPGFKNKSLTADILEAKLIAGYGKLSIKSLSDDLEGSLIKLDNLLTDDLYLSIDGKNLIPGYPEILPNNDLNRENIINTDQKISDNGFTTCFHVMYRQSYVSVNNNDILYNEQTAEPEISFDTVFLYLSDVRLLSILKKIKPDIAAWFLKQVKSVKTSGLFSGLLNDMEETDSALFAAGFIECNPAITPMPVCKALIKLFLSMLSDEEINYIKNNYERPQGETDYIEPVKLAADIIQYMPVSEQKYILKLLSVNHNNIKKQLEQYLFFFDDLINQDDIAIQKLLREIDTTDLAAALYNADEDLKNKIFSNMSKRSTAILQEEISFLNRVSNEEIENIKKKIIEIFKKL